MGKNGKGSGDWARAPHFLTWRLWDPRPPQALTTIVIDWSFHNAISKVRISQLNLKDSNWPKFLADMINLFFYLEGNFLSWLKLLEHNQRYAARLFFFFKIQLFDNTRKCRIQFFCWNLSFLRKFWNTNKALISYQW